MPFKWFGEPAKAPKQRDLGTMLPGASSLAASRRLTPGGSAVGHHLVPRLCHHCWHREKSPNSNGVQVHHPIHFLPPTQPASPVGAPPLHTPASSRHHWTPPAMGCPFCILPGWCRELTNKTISKQDLPFHRGKAHKMTSKISHMLPSPVMLAVTLLTPSSPSSHCCWS